MFSVTVGCKTEGWLTQVCGDQVVILPVHTVASEVHAQNVFQLLLVSWRTSMTYIAVDPPRPERLSSRNLLPDWSRLVTLFDTSCQSSSVPKFTPCALRGLQAGQVASCVEVGRPVKPFSVAIHDKWPIVVTHSMLRVRELDTR